MFRNFRLATVILILGAGLVLGAGWLPGDDAATDAATAETLYARGIACELNGQYQDAFDCFTNALTLVGKDAPLSAKLTERLFLYNRLDLCQAGTQAEKATKIGTDAQKSAKYNELAEACLERGWYNKASVLLKSANALAPKDFYILDNMGKLNLLLGNYDEAIKNFSAAFEIVEKKDNPEDTNMISFHLGLAYFSKGDYPSMENAFEGLRTLHVYDVRTSPLLYYTEVLKGKDGEDALNDVRLTNQDGNWLRAIITLLKGLTEADLPGLKVEESIKEMPNSLEKTYAANSRYCEVHCYLGYYYLSQKKEKEAQEHFIKAVETKARRKSEFAISLAALRKLNAFKDESLAQEKDSDFPTVEYQPKLQPPALTPYVPSGKLQDNPVVAQIGDWAVYACFDAPKMYQTVEFYGKSEKELQAKAMLIEESLSNSPDGFPSNLTLPLQTPQDAAPKPFYCEDVAPFFAAALNPADPLVKKVGPDILKINEKDCPTTLYILRDLNGNLHKTWYADKAPFGGLVKVESKGKVLMEVVAFGSKGDEIPGGHVRFDSQYYSSDAILATLTPEQERNLAETLKTFKGMKIEDVYKTLVSFQTKKPVTFEDMLKDLETVRVVYVGEKHNSAPCHGMQLAVIQELHKKNKDLVIGFEMFFRTEVIQKALDEFIDGKIDENEFKVRAYDPCWSDNWYKYYRDIFLFARENKIKMVGLNCPKELKDVFRSNPELLNAEQRKGFAKEVDYNDERHKKITMWNFRGMMMSGMKGVEKMYGGQCIWDDTMGESVANYLVANPKAQMVVCVGSMHAAYRITMPGRAVKKAKAQGVDLTYRAILPHDGDAIPSVSLEELMRLDVGDYIFFVPTPVEQ